MATNDTNSDSNRTERDASTPDRWPLLPLVSAADLPLSLLPRVQLPEEVYYPLHEHGVRRGESAYGTVENHGLGILGEGAVAHFFGATNTVDTALYDRGDGGTDLELHGVSIDVKTAGREHSHPRLIVSAYQPLRADYYALVNRVGTTSFVLVGYAPRQFVANAPVRECRGEPCHVVPREHLFPFPSVMQ
jgi:hypothetical protein